MTAVLVLAGSSAFAADARARCVALTDHTFELEVAEWGELADQGSSFMTREKIEETRRRRAGDARGREKAVDTCLNGPLGKLTEPQAACFLAAKSKQAATGCLQLGLTTFPIPGLPLIATPTGSPITQDFGPLMTDGKLLQVTVMEAEDAALTAETAEATVKRLASSGKIEKTEIVALPDGWLLNYRSPTKQSVWVQRKIAGVVYQCEGWQDGGKDNATNVAFCKSLRAR